MAHIPGLNPTGKQKAKVTKADGRQCQVLEESGHGRCVVSFTLKGVQQRAVLPLDRLYSEQGPCARQRPPVRGDKLLCDMVPVDNQSVNARWLVVFAWRGKPDAAPRCDQLTAVTGMLSEVGRDQGVLLFVTEGGCRERCAFGRAAVQTDGAPLPVSEPLSAHMDVGETALFDCRPTTAAANCRWLADRVWLSAASDGSYAGEEEEDYEEDEERSEEVRQLMPSGGGGFIRRVELKAVVGRVDVVKDFKAVLTFEHAGQYQRALLLAGKYTFNEKATAAERRDLTRVLSRGDQVRFTCHEYDKPNGTDRCGWWVMEAVKLETAGGPGSVGREAGYFQSGHLYEKIGTVQDVLATEGVLHFVLDGRREVAWFSAHEVYINGRPCGAGGGRLPDALQTGQRVNFNAEPSPAPRGADWRCTCVWRGEMPVVEASKKRIEATISKKQKKSKSAKTSIDDLDDFKLPSSAGGDGWPAPVAAVQMPQSPLHSARGTGRPAKPPTRLRASMVDELDDFGGGSGALGNGGGDDWDLPSAGDAAAARSGAPARESVSSGPSTPLSDASPEHSPLVPSPTRAADPSRPPLVPLLEHSVPLPDPNLMPARPLPAASLASAVSAAARSPPGLATPRPANPPGLSGAYSRQPAAAAPASLLGTPPPVSKRDGLLPAPGPPPMAAFYGYPPAGPPAFWQPGLQYLGGPPLHHHMMYGGPAMPPLSVDHERLERMVRGGPLPVPTTAEQKRTLPAADWEAAAAAFKADPAPPRPQQPAAPAPAPAAPAQSESSPTLEDVERRQGALFDRAGTEPSALSGGVRAEEARRPSIGAASSLDGALQELELEDALGEALEPEPEPRQSPPPAVEPVSGRGHILAFVDESRGLAEWERAPGTVEQVMFDRAVCFWLGAPMDTLDLTDCYTPGAEVAFECVPAGADEPYQWVATHFEQVED